MRIVRQLANWLLENDRISSDYYQEVLLAIQGGIGDEDGKLLGKVGQRQRDQDAFEDSSEDWWNLRGAGGRAKVRRHRGGQKATRNTKPIKVDELDPILPDRLLPSGAAPDAFPLAVLLFSIDQARGNRRSQDWSGFAAAVAELYTLSAEKLHDGFLAAMKARGHRLGEIAAAAEMGSTLFPALFLSDLSGESVSLLRRRVDGEETDFSASNANWILHYPSFNVVNEACLVRNRLRRIYRLWIKNFSEWDACGTASRGTPGICLMFEKVIVPVPALVWWRLQDPAAPRLGSARGMTVFPFHGEFLNVCVDGNPVVFFQSHCIDPPCPPCKFGMIRKEGLENLPNPVQIVWPVVGQDEKVPVLSLPAAPETALWCPGDWARAVACGNKLSTGVPAETACPWPVLHLFPPNDGWIDMFLYRRDIVNEIPWDELDLGRISLGRWRMLLSVYPEFSGYAPWEKFYSDMVIKLFSDCPVLMERCNVNAFNIWVLLSVLEECPECVGPCLWRLTNAMSWRKIYERHPMWIRHCNWESLSKFTLCDILSFHPELADHCDLGKLDGYAWSMLLRCVPQFADRCDWEKLEDNDWESLLSVQPQLSVYRPTHA